MSRIEGGGVRLIPPKALHNYFFFEASRVYDLKSQKYTSFRAIDKSCSKVTFKQKNWTINFKDL